MKEIKKLIIIKIFLLSGTMVQPVSSYLEFNCGKRKDFDEEKLLKMLIN